MRLSLNCLFVAFMIAACSDNTTGSAPVTPIAPVNQAPVLSIGAVPSMLDERQPFEIDVSGTNDPDGDALTYQVAFSPAGSAQLVSQSAASILTVQTNEIDADQVLTVTVTVSDGQDEVSRSFDVALENYDRTPLFSGWLDETDSFATPSSESLTLGIRRSFSTNDELYSLVTSNQGPPRIEFFAFVENAFPTPSTIAIDLPSASAYDFYALNLDFTPFPDFVVHVPESDLIQIYHRDSATEISKAGEHIISGACSVASTNVGEFTGGTFPPPDPLGLIVGTENGLTALLNDDGSFTETRIIAMTGDFCAIDTLQFFVSENASFYDETRSEILPIRSAIGDALFLQDAIQVDAPANMTLVDLGAGFTNSGSFFTALLFAGETHDSDHQVTILHRSFINGPEQIDIPLPSGVPAQIFVRQSDYLDIDQELMITVPDTPYVYFLENLSSPSGDLEFGPIEYFDVGFDVTEIALIQHPAQSTIQPQLVTNDGQTLRFFPADPS